MAEVLRDLVVSLSLESDNFTRNIASINRQIKAAESQFRLAGAGIDNFGSTVNGMAAGLATLQSRLSMQQNIVTQYERALTAARNKLQENYDTQTKYEQRLETAREKHQHLSEAIELQTRNLEIMRDCGLENTQWYADEAEYLQNLKTEYAANSQEVSKLTGQCEALQRATQKSADQVSVYETKLNNAKAAVAETESAMKKLTTALNGAAWTAFGQKCEEAGQHLENLGNKMTDLGTKMTNLVSKKIFSLGKEVVNASLEFESSFASVRKTVNATEEEFADLQQASKQMSTEIAASTSEINEVMATGGQLGVATENLKDFTRVMIDLGNSCEDLNADDAATSIAKFANVMKTDQSQFKNIGSTIVELGNNFATTEEPIMQMAQRLAGAGYQVGLSESQVLGFAAALSSVGIQAQMGGSAFSKALIKMEVAAATGGQELEDFARVSGMSAKEFKALWEEDAASAFQAFIVGLSKLDEEGESAIAVLNDIGIKEIRLRDTMLRSVNATELFARAQNMANAAWEENVALEVEANKRYATTASQLTNVKNKAVLFAQQLGDDLNPTIRNVMQGVSDFIDKLMQMDESQRLNILKWAAIAAAAGPVILILGKVVTGIGAVTKGLGAFATAVGSAGGGVSGLMSVISHSPVFWLAAAAAVIAGTYALWDYVSGAKAAREAQAALNEVVNEWETNVKTAYESAKGLSTFGVSSEDFGPQKGTSSDWLKTTLETWTDGKKETDQIVKDTVKGFTDGTDNIRDALQKMKDSTGGGLVGDLDKDMTRLDEIDKQVESILKKRQNGLLTEEDTKALENLLNERNSIAIRYHLEPEGGASGFKEIQEQIDTVMSRPGAEKSAGKVWTEAYAAAAQGAQSYTDALNEQYDAQYRVIQAMDEGSEEDKAAKAQALEDLKTWYEEQVALGNAAYAETIKHAAEVTGVFEEGGQYDETASKIQQVELAMEKLASAEEGTPEATDAMNELVAAMDGLDEGTVVELTAGLASLSQAGIELPANMTAAEESLMRIKELLGGDGSEQLFGENLQNLNQLFGEGLDSEVLEIAATLNTDGLTNVYDAWAAGTHADIIGDLNTDNITTKISGIKIDNLTGYVTMVTSDGKTLSSKDIFVDPVTGKVNYVDGSGANHEIQNLVLNDETGQIDYMDASGALHQIQNLTIDKEHGHIDIVTGDGQTFTIQDYELAGLIGTVTSATVSPSATVSGTVNVVGTVKLNKLDESAAAAWSAATGIAIGQVKVSVGLGAGWKTKLKEAYDSGMLEVYGPDGAKISVTPEVLAQLTNKDLVAVDEDGTVHVVITPELGNEGALEITENDINQAPLVMSDSANENIEKIKDMKAALDELTASAEEAKESPLGVASNGLELAELNPMIYGEVVNLTNAINDLDQQDLESIGGRIANLMAALEGEGGTEEERSAWQEELDGLLEFVGIIQTTDLGATGENVMAGLAQGMVGYGWAGDAAAAAEALRAAVNSALGVASPATTMIPTGLNVAAGVGKGMGQYAFGSDASSVANSLKTALSAELNASTLVNIGNMAMTGLATGIRNGTATVVSAIRTAALKAVREAKTNLKIESPSKVFRDEVGVMVMRGFGEGIEKESAHQAKIIGNAARYLTSQAQGAVTGGSTDNSKTYNQNATVNVNVDKMSVNNDQDIQSLASEIANLVRRQQAGFGY